MSTSRTKTIRRVTVAVAATACLLIPVTVSPGQGIESNDACADESCCRELNSVCTGGGATMLHHYKSLGNCGTQRH